MRHRFPLSDDQTLTWIVVSAPDTGLMGFLFENGADPNVLSYINREGGDTISVLRKVYDEYNLGHESDFPRLDEMEALLKKYGAK